MIPQPAFYRLRIVGHQWLHETDVKWLHAVTAVRGQAQNRHIAVSCPLDEGQILRVCFVTVEDQ